MGGRIYVQGSELLIHPSRIGEPLPVPSLSISPQSSGMLEADPERNDLNDIMNPQ